jgi:hypothetical protein
VALTDIQKVRLNVQDNTPGLYMISDEEIEYLLEKNNGNIARASIDAAKIILLNLAQRSSESVDIFSINGSKSAEQYRLALELFLKDPNSNPLYMNLQGWVGGVSKSEMEENDANPDNNVVVSPGKVSDLYQTGPFTVGWRF